VAGPQGGVVPTPPARSAPAPSPTPGIVLPPPTVRVGILTEVPRVSFGAASGVVVRVPGRAEVLRLSRATFASATNQPPSPPRYRVQVASLAGGEGAGAPADP